MINARYASVNPLVISHSTYLTQVEIRKMRYGNFSTNICALLVVERETAQENGILETKNELKRRINTSARSKSISNPLMSA